MWVYFFRMNYQELITENRAKLTEKISIKNNYLWEKLIEKKVIINVEVTAIKVFINVQF